MFRINQLSIFLLENITNYVIILQNSSKSIVPLPSMSIWKVWSNQLISCDVWNISYVCNYSVQLFFREIFINLFQNVLKLLYITLVKVISWMINLPNFFQSLVCLPWMWGPWYIPQPGHQTAWSISWVSSVIIISVKTWMPFWARLMWVLPLTPHQ